MNRIYTRAYIRLVLGLAAMLFISCDDPSSPQDIDFYSGSFTEEYSFGKVTLFNDITYTGDWYRYLAVGFIDSIGDGNKFPLIVLLDHSGKLIYKTILENEPGSELHLARYDSKTRSVFAIGTDQAGSDSFYRIFHTSSKTDSIPSLYVERYPLTLQGTRMLPVEIIPTKNGTAIIAGWIEVGGVSNGFVAEVDSSGTILWDKYYDKPGMHVRVASARSTDAGYLIAYTYSDVNLPDESTGSALRIIDAAGNDRSVVDIQIPRLNIVDVAESKWLIYQPEYKKDSGFVLAGTIIDTPLQETGYIGIVDMEGLEIWRGELGSDSLFVPRRKISHRNIIGNIGTSAARYSVQWDLTNGYTLKGTLLSTRISGMTYIRFTDQGSLSLLAKHLSYDPVGRLTSAIAVIDVIK